MTDILFLHKNNQVTRLTLQVAHDLPVGVVKHDVLGAFEVGLGNIRKSEPTLPTGASTGRRGEQKKGEWAGGKNGGEIFQN